jgi:hypothetical protein
MRPSLRASSAKGGDARGQPAEEFPSSSGRALDTANALREFLKGAGLVGLAVWAGFCWFHLLTTVVRDYSPLPYWDYWGVVMQYDDFLAGHLGILWQQHNDHRIVFLKLLFELDMLLGHGLQIIPLLAGSFCYLGIWVILVWTLLTERNMTLWMRTSAALLVGILMGWRGSSAVLGTAFLLQWTLLEVATILALALFARVRPAKDTWLLAGSIGCGIVANYTAANGLFVWPLLMGAALLKRLSRIQITVLGVSAIASVGIFFIGYHSSNSLSLLNSLSHPIYWFNFVASYLSVPFGLMGHRHVGLIFGLISFCAFGLLFRSALKHSLIPSVPGIVLFGTYLFTLISGVLVSFGRMDPNDGAFVAAKAPRYVTIPLVSWAVLISAAIWVNARLRRNRTVVVIVISAGLLFTRTFYGTEPWVKGRDVEFAEQQLSVLSLESGIMDREFLDRIYPDVQVLKTYLPVLQRHHLSIYYFSHTGWLLKSAKSVFRQFPAPPGPGDITQVYPVHTGLQVMGWADAVHRPSYLPKVVFINGLGQVAGFGCKLLAGNPLYLASVKTPAAIAWVGFLQMVPGSKSFSAFVFDRRSKMLTPIGSEVFVPDISAASQEEIGDPIKDVQWEPEGNWVKNLVPPGVAPGTPPGNYMSSWAGGDQNAGSIRSLPVDVPAGHCIALPVLHGPSVGGLAAYIIDAATGKKILELPMQGADTVWRFWRFRLDNSVARFAIVVSDAGRQWGEWIAVGVPQLCR